MHHRSIVAQTVQNGYSGIQADDDVSYVILNEVKDQAHPATLSME
jgi:hypothetical protein